ncbi:MAG: stage V sporulation protein AA [Anaerotignum sp.]|nr:stage V sporulation protein AA [Anaerotignum sp.]
MFSHFPAILMKSGMEGCGEMEIYIKPVEKIQMVQDRDVLLQNVAEFFVSGEEGERVGRVIVFRIPSSEKKIYLLSVIDLIRSLKRAFPKAEVTSFGEKDILVEYLPEKEKRTKLWTLMKAAFVALILFVGAATTIMCFHTDVQLPLIFQNIYYIFYGENREMPPLLSVSYSIGLGVGIIVFFNHFSKFSLTEDPTPIEIEMTTYEKETNASIIDFLGKQKDRREP